MACAVVGWLARGVVVWWGSVIRESVCMIDQNDRQRVAEMTVKPQSTQSKTAFAAGPPRCSPAQKPCSSAYRRPQPSRNEHRVKTGAIGHEMASATVHSRPRCSSGGGDRPAAAAAARQNGGGSGDGGRVDWQR